MTRISSTSACTSAQAQVPRRVSLQDFEASCWMAELQDDVSLTISDSSKKYRRALDPSVVP